MARKRRPDREALSAAFHPRHYRTNRYVYPVLSRRAGGVSVGINLSPDKVCNFGCIYCQVDRVGPCAERFVELPRLLPELRAILSGLRPGGPLWRQPGFAGLAADQRRVADIAFSGDGEPTRYRNFCKVARAVAEIKDGMGFGDAKVVVITNASGLHRADVQAGLRVLDAHRGEVWAKLEAGTPAYFQRIARTDFPFDKVLANILHCARQRSIVIQSCFVRIRGRAPSAREIVAYVRRLRGLREAGARIHLVQVYTIARMPAYGIVSSLSNREVDAIAARAKSGAGLPARAFHGHVPAGHGQLGEAPPDEP
jgi:wyosine [tRNA(Phe)-imidazoG37] synthetase (radical SAM superfamily)